MIYLGVGKAFVASAIVQLCYKEQFGVGPLQSRLDAAFANFKAWAAARKIYPSMVSFRVSDKTKANTKYPDFRMKAIDCKVIISWLADLTVDMGGLDEGVLAAACQLLAGLRC